MDPQLEDASTEYDRRFDALAQMAADLSIPPDDAQQVIRDVLLSTLVARHIDDIDAWITAAFRFAIHERGGSAS